MAQRTRALVYTYEDTGAEEWGPSGFTSDRAIIEIGDSVNDRAIGEWLLHKMGKLPNGCRLIRTFQATGLDAYPHSRFWSPMVDAAMQWAGLDLPGKMEAVYDYRTVGHKVIRARTRTPAERVAALAANPDADGVRRDGSLVYAMPRGPYSEVK
jgi:hypothetical protein